MNLGRLESIRLRYENCSFSCQRKLTGVISLKESVREDIAFLKASPYIKKSIKLHEYVFDLLDSGRLTKVG